MLLDAADDQRHVGRAAVMMLVAAVTVAMLYQCLPSHNASVVVLSAVFYALVLSALCLVLPLSTLAPAAVSNLLLAAITVSLTAGTTSIGVVGTLLFGYMHPVAGACLLLPTSMLFVRRLSVNTLECWRPELVSSIAFVLVLAVYSVYGLPTPALSAYNTDAEPYGPELNLTWYLFASSFSRYLPYLVTLAWLHPLLDHPDIALKLLLTLATLFDASSGYSLLRLGFCGALLLSDGPVLAEMKNTYVWAGLLAFSALVSPFMKYLWLVHSSGNANFSFNQQLIFSLAASTLLAEYAAATQRVLKRKRPGLNHANARGPSL